ncbi:MAG: penicillin-binding protein 2 [bacterium]|nr:penicillin-binding protein 2 [bacterium]
MEVREHRDDLVRRLPALRLVFLIVVALIASCYWLVQVVHGTFYRERAENNRLRKAAIQAPRGLIYDRHGRLLVENIPSYRLLFDRSRSADFDASIRFASQVLDRPADDLQRVLERARGASVYKPVLLAEDLALAQVARFSVEALEHPEFEIDVEHLRLYRHGPTTAHVLGYLGEATDRELQLAAGELGAGDLVGRRGIESRRDSYLRGRDGERVVVVDSRGRLREEYGNRQAFSGRDLQLALDLDLQEEAARYFENRVGAAIALDPRNGEILAFASSPSYNPNVFARRLDRDQWQNIVEAPNDPLQNRAVQNTYSPGSVFKIVVAVAGLEEAVVNEKDRVFCRGATRIYNRRFRCWKAAGHGSVNLHQAIRESCDVFFYHLGQKLGIEKIAHYARLFGLGGTTGIDLEGEKRGLVPDLEWSLKARGEPWYPGETISVAIGQGPLLVTPLQMASLMAVFANGGYRIEPHLVARDGTAPRREVAVGRASLEVVRKALWAVVNDRGTGASARLRNVDIAGKTGTVQVVEQKAWIDSSELPFEKRDHAWFGSFAPAEDAELVVVVFVEHGGKGSEAAAPLARNLYEKYFNGADGARDLS